MKNKDVIINFVNGAKAGEASNIVIVNNRLYNYGTVIAYRSKTGTIWLNGKHYSPTTSTNQNYIRNSGEVIREYDTAEQFDKAVRKDEHGR